jgi:hypothetical protein
MAAERKLYGLYNDDHVMVEGAKTLVGNGVHINDAYSPFPVHGIDRVIGVKWTRIAICAFLYGITGALLAVVGTYYFMIVDWPMDIGGKPNWYFYQNLPAFIPIIFEFAVLCAAHGMALTYFARNNTWPGAKASNPDPRTTDDHFALEIVPSQNTSVKHAELVDMLKKTGTVEVFEK